jgi:hypothetical protein
VSQSSGHGGSFLFGSPPTNDKSLGSIGFGRSIEGRNILSNVSSITNGVKT